LKGREMAFIEEGFEGVWVWVVKKGDLFFAKGSL
jgi:hypothetical protein